MGKQGGGQDTEVYLGAFGKHPAWNDHINDLGLETQRLVDFKTLVYIDGVAPNIESGKWDKLDPDARVEGFAHVMLMRSRGDLILARLWSSRDGKGRDKYPMAVVVQLRGAPTDWAIDHVLPELESVQQRCQAATTAEEVLAILDSARSTLRARLAAVACDRRERGSGGTGAGAGADFIIPGNAIPALAARPDMGPQRMGLYRILYQLQREAEMFQLGSKPPSRIASMGGKGTEAAHLTSVHLRLPATGAGANDVAGALRGALHLLLARLESWATMLLIVRVGRAGSGGAGGDGVVDAMIGEPQGPQLFALQASEKSLPLTTQIPYTIDASFAHQADAWVASRTGADTAIPLPDGARRSGSGRFLLLALVAVAGTLLSHPTPAAAQSPAPPPIPAQAEPRQLYNKALSDLKLAVLNSQTPDAETLAAANKFLADVRALPGGIAYLASVQETLRTIESAMSNADAGSVPAEVLQRGPAAAGGYAGTQEGRIVRFKPTSAAPALPELAFARVDMPGGEAVFVATTECSVGQFASIVSTRSGPSDFVKILRQFDRVSDPRPGPRAWEWLDSTGKRGGIRIPANWLATRSLVPSADYPKDARPAPPTLDSPMQHLSPSAALYVARLAGCRFPTAAEWAAAKTQFPAAGAPNLRDRTWKTQFDFAAAQRNAGGKNQLPDAGAFTPPGFKPSVPGTALNASDSVLWFTPVAAGSEGSIKNLVGNVAEFILDVPAADQPEPRPTATADFITEHAAQLHVIGGSALSDPAIPTDQPQPVLIDEAQEGYADVGFRLAFSANFIGGQSLAARLNRLLEPLPTLPVR